MNTPLTRPEFEPDFSNGYNAMLKEIETRGIKHAIAVFNRKYPAKVQFASMKDFYYSQGELKALSDSL